MTCYIRFMRMSNQAGIVEIVDDDIMYALNNLQDMLPLSTPTHFPDIISKCQRQDSYFKYWKSQHYTSCDQSRLFKAALNKHKEYYSTWISIDKKK